MDSRFIGEPIEVEFDKAPLFTKRPHCPDRFIWDGTAYSVAELIEQNTDFNRRGRFSENMQPEHLSRAQQKGSWGVGRYSFVVRTGDGRVFEIYYTREPRGIDRREGEWFLRLELLD